jgi:hypothetical protein
MNAENNEKRIDRDERKNVLEQRLRESYEGHEREATLSDYVGQIVT